VIADAIGWLAFILNVWGNLSLTKLSAKGWIIRLASNGMWLIYSAGVGAWPLFGNHAVFTLINIYGYWSWWQASIEPSAPQFDATNGAAVWMAEDR
jgi:hypothetical protein